MMDTMKMTGAMITNNQEKTMFTVGADPELFFRNQEKLISVVGILGGSKTNPYPIGNGCAIQEDNVAAEFCIPPANDAKEFVASINFALSDINNRAAKLGLTLAALTASGEFSKDQLNNRQARTFGCDPDFNAYTGEPNPRPRSDNKLLRSAGGHVHVGTDKDIVDVVQTLDLLLGVPSVLIDKDEERRKLYGKAGCFRPKPYGVEYRTLSNFWIWDNKTIEWVYHRVGEAISFCDEFIKEVSPEETQRIVNTINNNDKDTAELLVNKWSLVLP
jgi:hypothetical protein